MLGGGGQKYVLGRGQAVHRWGMVLRQVVGIETGVVQPLNLFQPLAVNLMQAHAGRRLNVGKNADLHGQPPCDISWGFCRDLGD